MLNIRGVPSDPVSGAEGDHVPTEAHRVRHAELGGDEHMPTQEREECDTRTIVAALDRILRIFYVQRAHQGIRCHRGALGMHGDGNGQVNATQQRVSGRAWSKMKMVVRV